MFLVTYAFSFDPISLLLYNNIEEDAALLLYKNKIQGAPGIEPGTSRSAVECSTTELYPLILEMKLYSFFITLSSLQNLPN